MLFQARPVSPVHDASGERDSRDDDGGPEQLLAQVPPAHQIVESVDGRLVAVVAAVQEDGAGGTLALGRGRPDGELVQAWGTTKRCLTRGVFA